MQRFTALAKQPLYAWPGRRTFHRLQSIQDRPAPCLYMPQRAAATKGRLRRWDAMREVEQQDLLTSMAGLFQAMD